MSRHDPLTPEERALANALAPASEPGPSPATDALVLAAARGAAAGTDTDAGRARHPAPAAPLRRDGRRRQRRHWPATLGLAASVALAVGVAWQLREPPQPLAGEVALDVGPAQIPPARQPVAADAAAPPVLQERGAGTPSAESEPVPAPRPARAAPATASPDSLRARDEAPRAAARSATAAVRPAPGVPPARASVQEAAAPAAPASVPEPPPPPSPPAPAAVAPPPAPPAPAAPAAPPAPPAPAASQAQMQVLEDTAPQADPYAPSPMADTTAKALAQDPRDVATGADARQWLQRIREQHESGDQEGARASLARFVRSHPGHPVPEDLQPLLPHVP